MSDGPLKIVHGRVDKIEALVNEASGRFQMISLTWTVLHDQLFGTATMVDKRELAGAARGPLIGVPTGRPFGS